jgi:hypothetical protein
MPGRRTRPPFRVSVGRVTFLVSSASPGVFAGTRLFFAIKASRSGRVWFLMRNEEGRRISRYDHLNDWPSSFSSTGQREAQREFLWGLQGVGSTRKAARMTRAAQNSSWLQVEDEENDPDWLADEAVVS